MKKSHKFYLGVLIFSIFISIPLIIPYFHSGFFPTHDGEWTVVRLADMFRELKDLQIPPRYSGNLNFGYGYPLFNFAYPFPYYLAIILKIIGFGYVSSIKAVFVLSIPISAFFMFLASRSLWKNDFAGIVSSVLYLYFPYRLVDLYVRGSIGESVAFAIFPIILLSLIKLVENPKSSGYKLLGGVMFASLILSHNIMAVLFSLSLLILFIGSFIIKKNEIIRPYLSVYILGMVLSAFFWIPALLEKKYVLLSQIPIADRSQYFVSIDELLFSKWGYGIPTDPVNGFSYQLGWPFFAILVLVGIVLIYSFYKKLKLTDQLIFATTLFVGILVFSLLMFKPFAPVWNLPLLSEINFPWTVLSQLGLLISLLAGFLVTYQITKYLSIGFAMLALILYVPFAKPSEYVDRGEGYYYTNDATTTSSNELMPLWVKTHPVSRPREKVEVINENGSVENVIFNSRKLSFSTDLNEDSVIRINTIYYPGWSVRVDGKLTDISFENEKGVIEIPVVKGKHIVIAKFNETKLRIVADFITVSGIIYVILILSKLTYKRVRKKWK